MPANIANTVLITVRPMPRSANQPMAKAAANDAAALGSKKSVQLHGGIGFTWECFVHIYLKRQMHNQMLLGDATHQRRELAKIVLKEA